MASALLDKQQILSAIEDIVGGQIVTAAPPTVKDNTRLIDELGLDSVAMLELITCIEERFDITISFEECDFETLNVAGCLATLVQGKLLKDARTQC